MILLIGIASFGYAPLKLLHPLAIVQGSHIKVNAPNVPEQFDKLLKRDLTSYLQDIYKEVVTVEYELLRAKPTQVGVALPKYYIWVKIYRQNRQISGQKVLIDEGAVKVAAVERTHFTVLNYLVIADLKKSPERINQVFPLPVGDKIRLRLK
ncbi:hypothetical protein [Pseudanabaena sp. ABRG5-3]|uniref:hypothetical protein n=1 Tax=Pseudanabaena sp. ABRG5-3 TaxID=685565 RepID=UPI0013A67FF1|nr:hypothetical protein [Pseudanabaena sp. ABRG5-3]